MFANTSRLARVRIDPRYRAHLRKDRKLPRNRNLQVYRERAERWRVAATNVDPGATQDAYLMLAEGYTELADFIELNRRNRDISADRSSDG
jgi:hypothetical protein